jgi:hypothetical protein
MLRRTIWPALLLALALGPVPSVAEPRIGGEASHRTFAMDAVVVDRQGVRTELTSFGRMFGSPELAAHLGDAEIQIPFERIRSFRVGVLTDTRAPVDVVLDDETRMQVEIDNQEYTTNFTGEAAFGGFRIMLGKIASCTLKPAAPVKEPIVRACPRGHRWTQPDYRFCPYDGEPLEVVVRKTLEPREGSR